MSAWSQTFTFSMANGLRATPHHRGGHARLLAGIERVRRGARLRGRDADLDKHCARLNRSAKAMRLMPTMSVEAMTEIATEGMKNFMPGAERDLRRCTGPSAARSRCPSRPTRTLPAFACVSTKCRCLSRPRLDRRRPMRSRSGSLFRSKPGRPPRSEQRAGADRGSAARLRHRRDARHAGQCRVVGHREHIPGEGRRGDDADGQRDVPQRRYPAAVLASSGPTAWTRARRPSASLFSTPRTRSSSSATTAGDAGQAHRRARPAAGTVFPLRPEALSGVRPCALGGKPINVDVRIPAFQRQMFCGWCGSINGDTAKTMEERGSVPVPEPEAFPHSDF